jgi:GAF domain-containing protein/HAMP domain-containing protein
MPDQTQASTAIAERESQSSSIDPNRLKLFRRTALFLSAGAATAIAFYTILGVVTGIWQIAAEAGVIVVALVCLAISYRMARSGRFDPAGYLVLFGLGLAYGGPELLWSSATVYLAVGGLMLIILVGSLLLPHKPRSWFIAAGLFSAFLLLANRVSWWPRFDYSQSPFLTLFVPFITVALTIAAVWLIVRGYVDYSLRAKLIIAFLVVSLVSVGAIALYADRTIRTALQDRISSELTNAAQQQGATIGDYLAKEVQLLQTLSLNEIMRDQALASNASYQGDAAAIEAAILAFDREWIAADNANDDTNPLVHSRLNNPIAEHLREYRALYPENAEVFVTDRYGALLAATNRTSDYYQADEGWWQAAFNNGQGAIYYTQPDYDASSAKYSIDIAFPLYDHDGQTIVGIMRTTVDLAAIVELLTNTHIGQTGKLDMLLPDNKFAGAQGAKDASPDLLAKLPAPLAGTSEVDWEDGVPSFAAVASIHSADPELGNTIDQLNWRIVAHQSRAEVLAPVDAQTGIVLLVIAAAAALAAGFSVALSQLLSRPILRLTTVAQQIAGGDLNAQAVVTSADEIGTLAGAFNTMIDELKVTLGNLGRRTEQLNASAEVGRATASILDTEHLLREVVNLISERFGFYYAAIFVIDEADQYAVLRHATGEAGRILKERGHKLPLNGNSMVSTAINTRKPRIALDVGHEPVRFVNPLLPDTRSEIALPLTVGNRVFGTLDVQSIEEAAFDQASALVLQSMADQIAIALENARLFGQTQQALQRAEYLSKFTFAIANATHSQEACQYMATYFNNIVQADRTYVFLIDYQQKQMVTKAGYGNVSDLVEQTYDLLQAGISGLVIQSGKPILSLSADDGIEPVETRERRKRAGTGALIVAPLKIKGEVIGTITTVNRIDQRLFNQDDIDLLMPMAAQTETIIENLRLLEQKEHALSDLDAINRRLTGEAWTAFSRQLNRAGIDWIGIGELIGAERADQPEVAEALALGRIAARTESSAKLAQVAVPIMLRGVSIGVIRLRVSTDNWSADTATTLTSIAGHIAQSVENARLIEQTSRTAQREKDIALAADRIHRAGDLEEVLRTTLAEVSRITGLAEIGIQIGRENDRSGN